MPVSPMCSATCAPLEEHFLKMVGLFVEAAHMQVQSETEQDWRQQYS